jgi:hypothetical protein
MRRPEPMTSTTRRRLVEMASVGYVFERYERHAPGFRLRARRAGRTVSVIADDGDSAVAKLYDMYRRGELGQRADAA